MAVLFTNNCWLFGLILVLIFNLSSANHYERKNDAISCSLVHPCPPGYYCSIELGETGVCHEEDESINEVFSGSGEKEHMEKREVDNSEMSKYYGEEEEYFDEQDEEAYMEKEEDGNSYVLLDEDEEEYNYEQDEIDYDLDDYQEEEDDSDEFSEYEDEDEEDEDEEYDYTEVDDEDDLEYGNDEDEYEEDYEQDETDDDFDDYQDEDDNYEQEEDVYEYDVDEKYRRKRFSPLGIRRSQAIRMNPSYNSAINHHWNRIHMNRFNTPYSNGARGRYRNVNPKKNNQAIRMNPSYNSAGIINHHQTIQMNRLNTPYSNEARGRSKNVNPKKNDDEYEEEDYEQDETDDDFDDYQEEEEDDSDEFSEYEDEYEDEDEEDEEYDYTEVDDEDDLEEGNDEDEYEEDYEEDETDDDFDDYQDEDVNYEPEEDVYEYDDDEKYRRKRSSPLGRGRGSSRNKNKKTKYMKYSDSNGVRGRSKNVNDQAIRMSPSYNSARKIDHRQFLKSESEKRNFKNGISSNMKSKPSRKQDSSSIQGKHSSNGKLSKKNKRPTHEKQSARRRQDLNSQREVKKLLKSYARLTGLTINVKSFVQDNKAMATEYNRIKKAYKAMEKSKKNSFKNQERPKHLVQLLKKKQPELDQQNIHDFLAKYYNNDPKAINQYKSLKSVSEKKNFKDGISSIKKSRKQDTSSGGKSAFNGKFHKKNKRPPHANGKENTLRKQDLKNRQSSCSGKHFKKTKPVHQKKDDQKSKENKYEDKDMDVERKKEKQCPTLKCKYVVTPKGSKCPVCGASVVIHPTTKQLATMEESYVVENFIRDMIPQSIAKKCRLSAVLTDDNDINILMEAVAGKYSRHCSRGLKEILILINDKLKHQ